VLHTTGTVHDGNTLRYRASKFDCEVCALKMQFMLFVRSSRAREGRRRAAGRIRAELWTGPPISF
jgi:hypothetical protein